MRGEDTQRDADGDAHQGGEDDLGQGLHGFLPVAQVDDEQQRGHGEQGEADTALDEVHQRDQQRGQGQRVEPQQAGGDAMDEEFEHIGNLVEDVGAVLRQPIDEGGDVLAQG
ncbi:MAG: hypothetical protein GAK45_01712 [Pseudomonas citronellolis]|nr:MAG: hypothetical protein GAK45_01712 [Pseudomonas citronellolis]